MTRAWWISVALLTLMVPAAAATDRDLAFDVRTSASLQVEAEAAGRYRYTWDWGDGETGVGARARHAYERPGVYAVALVAIDEHGREHRSVREVEVRAARPAVGFGIDLRAEGNLVRVEAEHEARARYAWDWGDGHRSHGRHATHAYAEPGRYEVELTVRHADGESSVERRTVVVRERAEVRQETQARHGGGGLSLLVGLGHEHGGDTTRDREAGRDAYGWSGDTRVSSSSYSHNDVPGASVPMLAAALAGAALVVKSFRRR